MASRFEPFPIPQSLRNPLPLLASTRRLIIPMKIPPSKALGNDCNFPNIAAVSENNSSSGPRLDPTPPASNCLTGPINKVETPAKTPAINQT